MKANKKTIIFAILTLIWTGVIFSFSLQPANQSAALSGGILTRILALIQSWTGIVVPIEIVHNLFRKLAHFAEFFLLGMFAGNFFKTIGRTVFYGLLYGGAIAVLDECLQFATQAGRAMRVFDMLLDIIGVLAALVILRFFLKIKSGKIN